MKSNFEEDLKGEKVVAKFLEEYFYSKFNFVSYVRKSDSDSQNKGIDFIFETKQNTYFVDEKAALNFPKGLPTFAFELTYLKEGMLKEGWFYDDKKLTEFYVLIWPIRDPIPVKDLKIEHIHSAEIMLVHRKNFQDYIFTRYNLNKESFRKKADEIRNAGEIVGSPLITKDSSAKYYFSTNYVEEPINLVFRKSELLENRNVVWAYYNVTREGYENLLVREKDSQ